jgi:tetratricopeptide (TPR) repeat protein
MSSPAPSPRDNFESALALGHQEYLSGRYDRAIAAYSEAIGIWPRPIAYLLRAAAYDRLGDREKAEADRKAVERLC